MPASLTTDTVIVGAGVIGLAVARQFASRRQAAVVLEKGAQLGNGISSRNSEVIHGGLYYPPGSLKAETCHHGRQLLYAYCQQQGIPYQRCGKLVVATDTQQAALATLHQNAIASGAQHLQWVSSHWLQQQEPWLGANAALLSHDTGIIDSHRLMQALQYDAEQQGATFCFQHRVVTAQTDGQVFQLLIEGPNGHFDLTCKRLINAAGLGAVGLAQPLLADSPSAAIGQQLAKGNYFALKTAAPTRRLIYPLPETHGLGVHLTLDLANRARFGPDVEWVQQVDFTVNASRHRDFATAIKRYWPTLPTQALTPDYAGIRPKLTLNGVAHNDFLLQTSAQHHINGLVNLLGIESPGLTAALAIAKKVVDAF